MSDIFSTTVVGYGTNLVSPTFDGSAWTDCPEIVQFNAKLLNGSSAVVVLELRDTRLEVVTAATITLDTISEVLYDAILSRNYSEYRFRQTSGNGTAIINS